jgi:hypothetical protein
VFELQGPESKGKTGRRSFSSYSYNRLKPQKCPENHPACQNCQGKDLVCVYPPGLRNDVQYRGDPARDVSSQLAYLQPLRKAADFTIADMCLLQHFITDAHPHLPVGNDDIYTRALPALTYKVRPLWRVIDLTPAC